jgi:hypothetical protein
VAFETLRRAEEAFEVALGPPERGRLGDLPTIRRLLWVLQRLDRYAAQGEGQAGAGMSVLEGQLDAAAYSIRWYQGILPGHLAYFLPELEETARRWKHQWAPKVKDRRIAAGKRAPRRKAGSPGRGAALGFDPKKRRRRQRGRGQ